MEPVFMILGQSAAIAATIAIDDDLPIQNVPYSTLAAHLHSAGQILTAQPTPSPSGRGPG